MEDPAVRAIPCSGDDGGWGLTAETTSGFWFEAWPWLVVIGLGALHGVNPAMGWLFGVALGLQRKSRAVVFTALFPIAIGHALSIAMVALLLVLTGRVLAPAYLRPAAGLVLVGWAAYLLVYGHRHRVRFGMTVGMLGLAAWSFLMATAHGAGLMLWPALMPLCVPQPGAAATAPDAFGNALLAVALHTAAMLVVTGAIGWVVYDWVGLAFLRSAWVNIDRAWAWALAATGALLVIL